MFLNIDEYCCRIYYIWGDREDGDDDIRLKKNNENWEAKIEIILDDREKESDRVVFTKKKSR